MAGRKQHYLPQFLLRGFSSRSKGTEHYTWFFQKDKDPIQPNINNIAAKRDFYGKPGQANADQVITDQEAQLFAPLIDRLRATGKVSPTDQPSVNKFVISLAVRTRHVRESFHTFSDEVIEYFKHKFQDPVVRRRAIEEYFSENPDKFDEFIQENIERSMGSQTDMKAKRFIADYARQHLMESVNLESAEYADIVENLLREVQNNLSTLLESSHNKALSESPVPQKRVSKYNHLRWSIITKERGSFILGDVGPITFRDGQYSTIFQEQKNQIPENIFLSLSDYQLLIGSPEHNHKIPEPDNLNMAAIEMSREFFISGQNTPRERSYIPQLATRAALVPDEEFSKMKEDWFPKAQTPKDVDRRQHVEAQTGRKKIGRNEKCPCGSRLKYKKCCL